MKPPKPPSNKKRIITMPCGHKVSVYCCGTKEKNEQSVRMLKDTVLCEKCLGENLTNSLNVAASIGCRRARCVELIGTEKQIKWAEVIRYAHLLAIDEYREFVMEEHKDSDSQRKTALTTIVKTLKWLKGINESKWWIENHGESCKPITRNRSSWRKFRDDLEIFRLAMKILPMSPHMHASAATALGIEERWNECVKNKTIAEAEAKSLAERIVAHEQEKHELIARARALAWHGSIKPWLQDGDYRLFFNDMGNCSICWHKNNFDKTVRFWRMDDTPEARQLAKKIWKWCNSIPNSDKACRLEV